MLKNKVKANETNEDLLFYYLNLTIADEKEFVKKYHKTMMFNAYDANPKRFCRMFESSQDGGISFQLLKFDHLKKVYRDLCDTTGN